MKAKINKVVKPIFLSIFCGFLCGKLVYSIYNEKTDILFNNNVIYLLQSGAYSDYENMRTSTVGYDYVYYEDDGLYKAIIGITKNKDNVNKIKKLYNGEIIINEYYLNNDDVNKKIISYDELLFKEENEEKIREIITDMLNIYKEEEIKLTKIS